MGVPDEVADHEKVGGETHLDDDVELVVGATQIFLWYLDAGETTLGETVGHFLAQPRLLRFAVGNGEDRHAVAVGEDVGVGLHPVADLEGVVAGVGDDRIPLGAHLVGGLQVVAVAVELESCRVGQRLTGLHTQQRLVARGMVFRDVVAVVGDDRLDAELAADVEQAVTHTALDLESVLHQLEIEVLLTEDLLPFGGRFESFAVMTETQTGLDLAGRTPRGRDDALGVFGDEVGVHAGPLAELALDGRQ